jgi:cupin 2 domain-containing protein
LLKVNELLARKPNGIYRLARMSTPPIPKMRTGNLFTDAAPPLEGERFETLLSHKNLVVERIVSSALIASQEYVQAQDEWVLLVQGEAVLQVAGESISLRPGDHLFLPAGVPHRVERTSPGAMWLAVHLHPEPPLAPVPAV